MNKESFWIFGHLGLGDHITCNALYRHYAEIHKDKTVIIPIWEHNLAAVQWMLSDVPNIFFYPLETEQQLLTCRNEIDWRNKLCLGFYNAGEFRTLEFTYNDPERRIHGNLPFNPVIWDSEFYRQAGLDPELKWKGFKLPLCNAGNLVAQRPDIVMHHDPERKFIINDFIFAWKDKEIVSIDKTYSLGKSCIYLSIADEIHCIDSSMLNLADLMETPYCKRFVFHRYARRGLPPTLRKPWEILD